MRTFREIVQSRISRHLRQRGFEINGATYSRVKNDVIQFVFVDGKPCQRGEPWYTDIALHILSPALARARYGDIEPGIGRSQIRCSLAYFSNKRSEDGWYWLIENEDDLQLASQEMVTAFDQVGLPILDDIDTTERVIEMYAQPRYALTWVELAKWEIALYRGEATLADKPERYK